ncbi:MAG: hypothetical protein ACM3UR_01820 [Bacteroidota bacterium]|jgi:flagellar biosynthesis GTPase FlhF|nr:hypothetical protein [Ignavibacteria bacterium]MCU7519141.1 hypothetical protein [Ignavibacteria bacterium]
MKKKYFIIPMLFLSFGFLAYRVADHSIDSILQKLQMTSEDAKEYAWSDCSGCYFGHPMPGELKDTPLNERPLIVKAVGEFVKLYSKSEDFKRRYLEQRDVSKPQPPESPKSMAEIKKNDKEQMKKSLQEMEKAKASLPASQRGEFEKMIQELKQQMAEMDKQDNVAYSSETEEYMKQGYEAEMKEYQERLKEWERDYPNEPDMMIRRWLEEFLKASSDVDFDAQVSTDEFGKKRFVNADYEHKPDIWKLCFRAGRQTTEAGRKFAESWLKELK